MMMRIKIGKDAKLSVDESLSVLLPEKWIFEGIHPPTIECKNLAKSVVLKLYKDFSIYPIRISATVEEGIFIKYINHINKRELSIEVYNDLDIAAIITKEKEIIASMDIQDISDENSSEIFRIFYQKQERVTKGSAGNF